MSLEDELRRIQPVLRRHFDRLAMDSPVETRTSPRIPRGQYIDVPEISPFAPATKIDPHTGRAEFAYRTIRWVNPEDFPTS